MKNETTKYFGSIQIMHALIQRELKILKIIKHYGFRTDLETMTPICYVERLAKKGDRIAQNCFAEIKALESYPLQRGLNA